MKKLIFYLALFLTIPSLIFAKNPPDEGMWVPMFIEQLNFADMQKLGFKLTAQQIYDVNNASIKDAIVGMNMGNAAGNFCTGEIISGEGLFLTNHHCAYDNIQSHSTVDKDYLSNGFWAMNRDEELPNEGLCASILVRMEDVTPKVLDGITDSMDEASRLLMIEQKIQTLQEEASEGGKYQGLIKSFFEGNEYYLLVYQTFKDIRLVGAPPSSIGKFGGDTDNWMWPRHTGDFSMYRIYTAPDGTPAKFSKNNVPYKPKHFLPVSLNGVKKDDFTMIWGFPGSTDRFLTSWGVKLAVEESNPTVVKIRDKKLAIIDEDMKSDPAIRIKYASKYAQTANYWKYYIGQTKGLKRLKVYDKKKEIETAFEQWVKADATRTEKYGNTLSTIENGYTEMKKYNLAYKYIEEAIFQGPEILYFSFQLFGIYNILATTDTIDKKKAQMKQDLLAKIPNHVQKIKKSAADFYKDYNANTDKKLFAALLKMYFDEVPADFHFKEMTAANKKYKGNFDLWAEEVYKNTILADEKKFNEFLNNPTLKVLNKDPGFNLTKSARQIIMNLYRLTDGPQAAIEKGNRQFVEGLRQMNADKKYYPNANSTLRMTYGKVGDYFPADGVRYHYVTTLKGIMEKEDPNNDEFIVPDKLKTLYKNKDYGIYGEDGEMVVAFISNNDITGGNSGSPVINGNGELIGIAFDGNWEAMSGDIAFETSLQRTISVDIRYVLFIIDKFAGAGHLLKEMKIVHDKAPLKDDNILIKGRG